LRDAGVANVGVVGNLKFDLAPDPALLALGKRWKARLARAVVLAAITREGEEALILAAWHAVPLPRPLLAIVPRHPQRFEAVAELVASAGFSLARRSAWTDSPPAEAARADVWLGDSMMEMPAYYALADVALLGGSFLPFGGQNLIEAAACGCPVVMGPHTFNFSAAASLSLAAGASLRVAAIPEAIAAALARLGGDELARRSAAALSFAAAHRGAAERSAARILAAIESDKGPTASD
jgi:3-deoxy-D-manno-octulosonic-acid transferase